jgi:hypothetical protein
VKSTSRRLFVSQHGSPEWLKKSGVRLMAETVSHFTLFKQEYQYITIKNGGIRQENSILAMKASDS